MSSEENPDSKMVASTPPITMIAKYGKQKIELPNLAPSTTIAALKELLREKTGILPKRQKMIGLKSIGGDAVTDETMLVNLKAKKASDLVHQFILMGTPEEQIFVDPSDKNDLPSVIDDFDFDFNAGSDEVSFCCNKSIVSVCVALNITFVAILLHAVDRTQGERRKSSEIHRAHGGTHYQPTTNIGR